MDWSDDGDRHLDAPPAADDSLSGELLGILSWFTQERYVF